MIAKSSFDRGGTLLGVLTLPAFPGASASRLARYVSLLTVWLVYDILAHRRPSGDQERELAKKKWIALAATIFFPSRNDHWASDNAGMG
jgi:hypothetical protein